MYKTNLISKPSFHVYRIYLNSSVHLGAVFPLEFKKRTHTFDYNFRRIPIANGNYPYINNFGRF